MALLPATGLVITGDVTQSPTGTYNIASTSSFGNYVQSGPHNWTGNHAILEVVSTAPTAGAELTLQARDPAAPANEVSIQVKDGTLRFRQDNVQLAAITYDLTAHRWWRLEHAGADVVYSTAPDGVTWVERHRVAAAFLVNGSNLRVFAYNATTTTERASVRNINTPPSAETRRVRLAGALVTLRRRRYRLGGALQT